MFCKGCRKKSGCVKICSKLERELRRLDGYLREDFLTPADLRKLFEESQDIFPANPMDWMAELLGLAEMVKELSPEERFVIEGYYWKGKSFRILGRALGVSRVEAFRKAGSALRKLRKAARLKLQTKKFISFLDKFGYNQASNKYARNENEKNDIPQRARRPAGPPAIRRRPGAPGSGRASKRGGAAGHGPAGGAAGETGEPGS
jgi:hypothetical protein